MKYNKNEFKKNNKKWKQSHEVSMRQYRCSFLERLLNNQLQNWVKLLYTKRIRFYWIRDNISSWIYYSSHIIYSKLVSPFMSQPHENHVSNYLNFEFIKKNTNEAVNFLIFAIEKMNNSKCFIYSLFSELMFSGPSAVNLHTLKVYICCSIIPSINLVFALSLVTVVVVVHMNFMLQLFAHDHLKYILNSLCHPTLKKIRKSICIRSCWALSQFQTVFNYMVFILHFLSMLV